MFFCVSPQPLIQLLAPVADLELWPVFLEQNANI